MRPAALTLGSLLLATPVSAGGPSFSCTKAASTDERAICRSPALSTQDRQLARAYRDMQSCTAMGNHAVNIEEQRDWLVARGRCGADRACLAKLYRVRIQRFAPMATKARRYLKTGDCPHPL
ncbi:MAG: hypothetical protein KGM49_07870 [Sphingomonadales bacterium]|nr:hypothetical protein [Sphingomonadales bacterium]